VRAIQRYWKFLECNELQWDIFPQSKSLKPTYKFRNQNLLKAIENGELKASTCLVYMNHIISFYEWAMYSGLKNVIPLISSTKNNIGINSDRL